jgi:4-diphosphocytidyl-2-C-methyl-D-erythritol kinase
MGLPDRCGSAGTVTAAGSGGISIEAPAKINLDLRVVGRRHDGYHLLESTLVLLELADRLALLPGAPGLRVEGASADIPIATENLAWRGVFPGL